MLFYYVYAHPHSKSFNAALRDVAISTLNANEQQLQVADLYQQQFQAAASWDDFNDNIFKNISQYNVAQKEAYANGECATEIDIAFKNLQQCDVLILQFPLWWFSMPAILKGWIDRVLLKGPAYDAGKWFNNGGLAGKKAMLVFTTQAPQTSFTANGLNGPIEGILHPIHHALRFVGFEILPPFIAYAVAMMDDNGRKQVLEQYKKHLTTIEQQQPWHYNHINDFNDKLQLKTGIDLIIPK